MNPEHLAREIARHLRYGIQDSDIEILRMPDMIRLGYARTESAFYKMVSEGRLPEKLPCGGWTRTQLREWSLKHG